MSGIRESNKLTNPKWKTRHFRHDLYKSEQFHLCIEDFLIMIY